MFGRLFQTLKPSQEGPEAARERQYNDLRSPASVTEDAHTFGLLFPSADSLRSGHHGSYPLHEPPLHQLGDFDVMGRESGAINVDQIRVIVARDEVGSAQRSVVYDTKSRSSTSRPPSPVHQRPTSRHGDASRDSQALYLPTSPLSPKSPGINRVRFGKPDPKNGHSRVSSFGNLVSPTLPWNLSEGSFVQRARSRNNSVSSLSERNSTSLANNRDLDEELLNCLDCAFGSTASSVKESTTKIHMMPSRARPTRNPESGFAKSPSMTRISEAEDGKSPLQYSGQSLSSLSHMAQIRMGPPGVVRAQHPQLLITRTFPIHATHVDSNNAKATSSSSVGVGDNSQRRKPRQPKPTLYAVAIVIEMPERTKPTSGHSMASPASDSSAIQAESKGSVPSSLGSEVYSSWTNTSTGPRKISNSNDAFDAFDSRTVVVLQQWDPLLRIMSNLQEALANDLNTTSSQTDVIDNGNDALNCWTNTGVPNPVPRLDTVVPLQNLEKAVESSSQRLSAAFSSRLAATGQNRWSVWRDEARQVLHRGQLYAHSTFLSTALTAFLATHLQWLAPSESSMRRKRDEENQECQILSSRTIIVCKDRLLSRRLLFLLSSFLPAEPTPSSLMDDELYDTVKETLTPMLKPSTSNQSSSSSHAGSSRQEDGACLRVVRQESPHSASRKSNLSNAIEASRQGLEKPSSIKSHNWMGDDGIARNAMVTMCLTKPELSKPRAHFASPTDTPPLSSSFDATRRESASSAASLKLAQNLTARIRKSHADLSTQEADRNAEAMFDTHNLQNEESMPVESSLNAPQKHDSISRPTAAGPTPSTFLKSQDTNQTIEDATQLSQDEQIHEVNKEFETKARDITCQGRPQKCTEEPDNSLSMPFKLSINRQDGCIDVDIPIPSNGSVACSPSRSDMTSGSNQSTSYEPLSDLDLDSHRQGQDLSTRCGGFLPQVRQDLAVQAVPHYKGLDDEIRAFMSQEPTPKRITSRQEESWLDVCSTVIADTRSGTVRRLKLRRLVRNNPVLNPSNEPLNGLPSHQRQTVQEEEITEEVITEADDVLLSTVEKLAAHSGQSSRADSAVPSRSPSPRAGPGQDSRAPAQSKYAGLDVPRDACRALIFGALEQIVKTCVMTLEDRSNETDEVAAADQDQLPMLKREVCRWLKENEDHVSTGAGMQVY
ncbi:MAG: hypothetical protein M1828_003400 [Chrysothrix sp. TS-e1954]|nr:MAG: hypothetical protein M1828_003400 [Chrysothrix sp. TS-e1954]